MERSQAGFSVSTDNPQCRWSRAEPWAPVAWTWVILLPPLLSLFPSSSLGPRGCTPPSAATPPSFRPCHAPGHWSSSCHFDQNRSPRISPRFFLSSQALGWSLRYPCWGPRRHLASLSDSRLLPHRAPSVCPASFCPHGPTLTLAPGSCLWVIDAGPLCVSLPPLCPSNPTASHCPGDNHPRLHRAWQNCRRSPIRTTRCARPPHPALHWRPRWPPFLCSHGPFLPQACARAVPPCLG